MERADIQEEELWWEMDMETGDLGKRSPSFSRSFGQKASKARGIVLLCLTF
jgi:hypothetical protein